MTAKEFLAHDYAGLALVGRDYDEKEYLWMGTNAQWEQCKRYLNDENFPESSLLYPRVIFGF